MNNYLTLKTDSSQKSALVLFSALSIFILFIWQGNIGFDLNDEGFLWYGVQRVMLGETPLLDFMSYDPGRYYWSASFMSLFADNGIIALRISVALFQFFGLITGLFLIFHTEKKINILYLLLTIGIFLLWMYPRHKLFDISLSIFLIGALTFLVEKPSNRRFFISGIFIGLIAFFGRNHGVYGVFGFLLITLWLKATNTERLFLVKKIGYSIAGIIIGYSPMLLMLVFVQGFSEAFWNSILFLFEVNSTNITLPIPWPWTITLTGKPLYLSLREILIGLFFIAIVAFSFISITWAFKQKSQPLTVQPALIASSFLSLPYLHFALSRADISHLAQGIFPALIGSIIYFSSQPKKNMWLITIVFFFLSICVMLVAHPSWFCTIRKQCSEINISNDKLLVPQHTANNIYFLRQFVKLKINNDDFLVTPFWPGAYAIFNKKAPIWEIYALFPRNPKFEQAEIVRIKEARVNHILIIDRPLDGREDLRFKNTHPVTHQYIINNYTLSKNNKLGSDYKIYRKNR